MIETTVVGTMTVVNLVDQEDQSSIEETLQDVTLTIEMVDTVMVANIVETITGAFVTALTGEIQTVVTLVTHTDQEETVSIIEDAILVVMTTTVQFLIVMFIGITGFVIV